MDYILLPQPFVDSPLFPSVVDQCRSILHLRIECPVSRILELHPKPLRIDWAVLAISIQTSRNWQPTRIFGLANNSFEETPADQCL